MADNDSHFDLSGEPTGKSFPWKIILGVLVVTLIVAFWIWYGTSGQKSNAQVTALEAQLDTDSAALAAQKDKVMQLTQQLESMKQAILAKQVSDPKKAVADYNKLAAEQRADREQYKTMANQYNEKVAKLHELQP
jgi:hypothetical protein